MRKSSTIRLVLMGAAVGGSGLLAGCGTDVQRNRYASMADCMADYSEAQCRPDFPLGATAVGAGVATYYYGPWYRSNVSSRGRSGDPGAGRFFSSGTPGTSSSRPAAVESGTRGGFGSHGRVSARGS